MSQNSDPVLIVDDKEPTRQLYSSWLQDHYTVHTATYGDAASAILKHEIDVILVDCDTVDWSRWPPLEELRERIYEKKIVLVAETVPDQGTAPSQFDECLVKPVSEDTVVSTVELLFQINAYDDLLQEYYFLASKLAMLRDTYSAETLRDDARYLEFVERVEAIQAELDQFNDKLQATDYGTVFRGVL